MAFSFLGPTPAEADHGTSEDPEMEAAPPGHAQGPLEARTRGFILRRLAHRKGEMARSRNNWGRPPWKITYRPKARKLPARVDTAIVGGGFSGLAAAALLKRLAPDQSVLVLEAGRLGNGASGRAGGMALSETAAGDLPGLGDVLRGYRRILRQLGIRADLALPGVWELGRGPKSMEGKP